MKFKDVKIGELVYIQGYAANLTNKKYMNAHTLRAVVIALCKNRFVKVSVAGEGVLKVHSSQLQTFSKPKPITEARICVTLMELKAGEVIIPSSKLPTPNEGLLDKIKVYNSLSQWFTPSEFDKWWDRHDRSKVAQ